MSNVERTVLVTYAVAAAGVWLIAAAAVFNAGYPPARHSHLHVPDLTDAVEIRIVQRRIMRILRTREGS